MGWRELLKSSNPKRCSICGFQGSFPPKAAATQQCPICKSMDRHRLEAWFLETEGLLRPGARVLHFAPELCLIEYLEQYPIRNETADLFQKGVMHKIDLQTQIIAADAYDLIIANHVMEHIPDDGAALRNIWRMLRSGGVALITVPIREGTDETDEDLSVIDPHEREIRFGQGDHVRFYGKGNLVARLAAAGFQASTWELAPGAPVGGVTLGHEILFLGRKP
jgi:SAM-dependent methyltransferase